MTAARLMLYALCSMLYALCSMLYALCSMLYALCSMLYALCSMLFARGSTRKHAEARRSTRKHAEARRSTRKHAEARPHMPKPPSKKILQLLMALLTIFPRQLFRRLFLFCFLCSTNFVSAVQKSDNLF
jgi:hypothetical protein